MDGPEQVAAALAVATTGSAAQIVAAAQAQPASPVQTALAQGFATVTGGLRPQFPAATLAGESKPAQLVLPAVCNAPLHLQDATSGVSVDVKLKGALPVAAQAAGGYVVYPAALAGATLLHRPLPAGSEDFISLPARPATPEIDYSVTLGKGVAGLRLVGGTLEMLDASGTPRLRVAPPYIVGADGIGTDGALAVTDCFVDSDPTPPWGRTVTDPGASSCNVQVTWPDASVVYPAILDPRWTTTGSMIAARYEHSLTVIASTGEVLAAGGRSSTSSTTALSTAEIYNKSTGVWTSTNPMSSARRLHSATQLNTSGNPTTSGKILVSGGISGSTSLTSAELYTRSTGLWSSAGPLNVPRHLHTATLLADGRVLVAGGMNGTATVATAALYNPASGSGSWVATTGPIPPAGWRYGTATLIQTTNSQLNNHVLLVGGNNGTSTISAVYLFDPVQNAFSTLASIPTPPREQHFAAVLPNSNGKILVGGGLNGSQVLGSAIVFDPSVSNGTWSSAGTMTSLRVGASAVVLPTSIVANGSVIVAGGSATGSTPLASAELFSGTSTWTATPSMPGPLQGSRAVLLGSNMILVAGGLSSTTVVQSASYLYDASFGLGCSSNSQCASGFCANGVCCDSACTGTCGACNLAGHLGTCSPFSNGTVCRVAAGECDLAETCNGSSTTCPTDAKKVSGTACTDDGSACTRDQCDGSNVACQHPAGNAGTICRASVGVCDAAEVCSGTSATCPADGFAPATTVCSPAAGGHGAETCTGTSAVCPASGEAFDVLGFESLADWTATSPSGTVVGLNDTETQGVSSFDVTAHGLAAFTSAPVESLGSVGTEMLLDIMLPQSQANPASFGTVQLSVNSPTLGFSNLSLGQVTLTGLPLQKWQTVSFPVTPAVSAKLSAGGYSDLTFTISLNVDAAETGDYLFDNLRSVADVIPSLAGIATNSKGVTKAVFTYTTAAANVSIPYGPSNALLDQNGFLAAPTERPPQIFVSETHAPFVATLTGSSLSWQIGTHIATATASSTRLPTGSAGDGTKDATLPDGRKVNLDSIPPLLPTPTADPQLGGVDTGVLIGDLQVNPSGAAVYTLPIVMAPSVKGVAPNLALTYNSQGPNGIAGQGWQLAGLSMIHKCPRTQQQDGAAHAVTMDFDPSTASSPNTSGDGICLDGERLFEADSNTYVPEKKDFSTITYFPSDNHFEVKTKTNEIRYYGLTGQARVTAHGVDPSNNPTTATAMWALERVTDAWGNFYYVHYNLGLGDFEATGLRVTEIDYTGHMSASGAVDTPPFASVKFGYESRGDIRWTRFALTKFPRNQRLKTITTDRGTYTLTYQVDPNSLISELHTVHYCTGATCVPDLTFDWDANSPAWPSSDGYALPSDIPTGHGLIGTQFIDLDGDGLTDLVYSSRDIATGTLTSLAWLNTGTGWTPAPSRMALPESLAQGGVAMGRRFGDIDGDGVPDFVADPLTVACGGPGCQGPRVWLNRLAQPGGGWESHPEYLTLPSTSTFATMQPIEFNGETFCDGTNADPANNFCEGFQHMTLQPATMVDINNDGLMDIVRVEEGGVVPNLTAANLEVLLNQGPNSNNKWVRYTQKILTDEALDFNIQPTAVVNDVNRDGFGDLLRENYYPASATANVPNQLTFFQQVALNENSFLDNTNSFSEQAFAPTLNRGNCTIQSNGFCNGGSIIQRLGLQGADIDGDGFYDEVLFGPINDVRTSTNLASGYGVAENDGIAPSLTYTGDAAAYAAELSSLAPSTSTSAAVFAEDFAYALADINGDGLPDLVRNHYSCANATECKNGTVGAGGGQVLFNKGTTWGSGSDQWQRSAGNSNPVPGVVPSQFTAGCGGVFVDLNGDGITDFIQEEGNNSSTDPNTQCKGSKVGRGAWLNSARAPIIKNFPNGRATASAPTSVEYVHITEAKAHTPGVQCDGVNANAVYCDDDGIEAGTKRLSAVPMRVVSKVSKADGTGGNTLVDTTYAYHSMRADVNGRGPLGFRRVDMYDHASGVRTETTFALSYPYTGMPIGVARSQVTQNNAPLTDTETKYCDTTAVRSDGSLNCSPTGTKYPPRTSLFVYPFDVLDTVNLDHAPCGAEGCPGKLQTTESSYQYDDFGNSKQVVVTTKILVPSTGNPGPVTASSVTSTTTNQYGLPGSEEEKQGKLTDIQTSRSGDPFIGTRSHHTAYAYAPVSNFGGASTTARALVKTELEAGSGWPTQEDTAVSYDAFGNARVTTMCANDFDNCTAGATSPSPIAFDHPPFRTTVVSFSVGDFNRPSGPGLISSLNYTTTNGRFPVRTVISTINAAGSSTDHVVYDAYDPIKGALLQRTGQDGLHTCYTYDDLGRPTSEVARCGSDSPITTTTAYVTPGSILSGGIPEFPPGTPLNTKLVTVTRQASGAVTWVFSDDYGKPIETLKRAFNGGFNKTVSTYNTLGQAVTVTKPFPIQNFADTPAVTYGTTTLYDGFNRVFQTTEDLGGIGDFGQTKQLVTTTTYNGLSLTTTRTVSGSMQTRTETKNALGKLDSVVDAIGNELDYVYDPDGNLFTVGTPAQRNLIVTSYDARGRKTQVTDTDMGTWNYIFDGFGDLVNQTDANNQQFAVAYDQLGRILTKQNLATAATAAWIYDVAGGGAAIGKLAAMVSEPDPNFNGLCGLPSGAVVSGGNRAVKTYAYTGLGDLQGVAECADGDTFQTSYEYDTIGRQSLIRYPAVNSKQLAVGYHYAGSGELQYLSDESSDYGVLWQATAMDPFGDVTDQQARNGVETVESRSPGNGWLVGSTSTAHSDNNTVIQNWTYTFDEVGNLLSRERADQVADAISAEGFGYDALNRLTSAGVTVGAPSNVKASSEYVYDGNGNLTQKDGKTYNYGVCPAPIGRSGSGLHQVCSIDSGPTYVYDPAGNLTSDGVRTVTYNAHNKAIQISGAAGSAQFMYGADDSRVVQVATSGTTTSRTVYVGLGGTGKSMYERTTTTVNGASTTHHTNFIYAGGTHSGNAFAVRLVDDSGNTTATRYLNFDHLGSTTAVSDETGHIATATGSDTQVLGYDPWGARRNPDGQPPSPSSTFSPSVGNRDFTGQETIPAVGLVNMNGRVYDPVLGRFLSPDPNLQAPGDLQDYNRYSYALNNPLRYTDPTGYDFWSALKQDFSNPVSAFGLLGGILACGVGGPIGCMAFGAQMALFNAAVALQSGASFGQIALNFGIGVGVGMLTSGIIGAVAGPATSSVWTIINGSASAALSTAITDKIEHRKLGWDVFVAAAVSAGEGAATLSLQGVAELTQAQGEEDSDQGLAGKSRRLRYQQVGDLSNESDIQWKLSGAAGPSGGYIVQHVTADIQLIDESGNVASEDHWNYWEAWKVDPGSRVTEYAATSTVDDTFIHPGGHGTWTITGTARYYDGVTLPDSFVVENPLTHAGILPSTTVNPQLPETSASQSVVRSYTNFW